MAMALASSYRELYQPTLNVHRINKFITGNRTEKKRNNHKWCITYVSAHFHGNFNAVLYCFLIDFDFYLPIQCTKYTAHRTYNYNLVSFYFREFFFLFRLFCWHRKWDNRWEFNNLHTQKHENERKKAQQP